MKSEHPILFSGRMVRAILAGQKTETRRPVKPQPGEGWDGMNIKCEYFNPTAEKKDGEQYPGPEVFGFADEDESWKSPYGAPGDRLWVRETWLHDEIDGYYYRADKHEDGNSPDIKWRPAIFMPRACCRIYLQIEEIRVERLQAITHQGAIAEGIDLWLREKGIEFRATLIDKYKSSLTTLSILQVAYSYLWEEINGKGSWDLNPWVWVIKFKRIINAQ